MLFCRLQAYQHQGGSLSHQLQHLPTYHRYPFVYGMSNQTSANFLLHATLFLKLYTYCCVILLFRLLFKCVFLMAHTTKPVSLPSGFAELQATQRTQLWRSTCLISPG